MVDILVLVNYFKEGKKKGFSSQQLHKSLIQQGYNIEDIQKAFSLSEENPTETMFKDVKLQPDISLKPKSHNPLIFIVGFILVIILIIALVFIRFNDSRYNGYSEDLNILPEDNTDNLPPEIIDSETEDNTELPPGIESETEDNNELPPEPPNLPEN